MFHLLRLARGALTKINRQSLIKKSISKLESYIVVHNIHNNPISLKAVFSNSKEFTFYIHTEFFVNTVRSFKTSGVLQFGFNVDLEVCTLTN